MYPFMSSYTYVALCNFTIFFRGGTCYGCNAGFWRVRYEGVKKAAQMSLVSWRPEIPSLIMGLTVGICAEIAASNLSITQDNSEDSVDVAQFESYKFEFYEALKNR